jgi:hypothetical protein
MKLLLQSLLLAQAGDGADRPYESPISPPEVNFWWVIVAVLARSYSPLSGILTIRCENAREQSG